MLLEYFFKCKLYLKNSIKLIKKNCGRQGEDFSRHQHSRKQEHFSFWLNVEGKLYYKYRERDVSMAVSPALTEGIVSTFVSWAFFKRSFGFLASICPINKT